MAHDQLGAVECVSVAESEELACASGLLEFVDHGFG
jgi:hypothetical protein